MTRNAWATTELRSLRYFVAVAEELHFGRAAARLFISQPPLSEQIRLLEERLELRLFERSRRGVALTTAGRTLYAEAIKLIEHSNRVHTIMDGVRTGQGGDIFIGCVPLALFGVMPKLVRAINKEVPELNVHVSEAHTSEVLASVREGRLDAGLVWQSTVAYPLVARALEEVDLIVALHKHHPLGKKKSLSLASLATEPLVMSPREVVPQQYDLITASFFRENLSANIKYTARSVTSQLGFVAIGLAYALVPKYATKLRFEEVEFRPLSRRIASMPLSLVWNAQHASARIDALRDIVNSDFPLQT